MPEKLPTKPTAKRDRDPSSPPPADTIAAEIKSMANPIENLLNRPDAQDDPDIDYIKRLGGFRPWINGQVKSYKDSKVDSYWASVQIWQKVKSILDRYK